jgi:glutamyl-tRNA reductase
MSFLSVGIDHEHAPLDLLERASVGEEGWGKVLGALLANSNIDEAVFVSTCLRTEVYASIDRFHGAIEEITATLAESTGVAPEELSEHLTIHFDRGVAAHLFAVAAGLRSAVPGEYEVLGQLRRALERADEEHAVGPELAELFRRSLAAGRRARAETSIARGTTSFAQATVHMAEAELGTGLVGADVVVLGAGQLATGVVKSLRDAKSRVGTIWILNRTLERAEELAGDVNDDRVRVAPLEHLGEVLAGARLVIAALDAPTTVLARRDLQGREAPILIVDLAMPRVINVDVDNVAAVRRLDISHLRDVVARTLAERQESVDAATAIVDAEVEKFHEDRRSRGAAAIVGELREHLEALRVSEIERRSSDLTSLDEHQREIVESLTRSLIAKIAHTPTVALKEAAGTDRGQRLYEATRNLFDL